MANNTMERIPLQTGFLLLNEEGAVLQSGGELENDETTANVIINLLSLTNNIDNKAFGPEDGFKKMSITYENHCYIVCSSNRRIHVVKKQIERQNVVA